MTDSQFNSDLEAAQAVRKVLEHADGDLASADVDRLQAVRDHLRPD